MVLCVGVTGVPRARRAQLAGGRRRQVVVRFSDAELALVRRAAEVSGQALGGWIGEVAVRSSEGPGTFLGADRKSCLRQLVRLRLDIAALPGVAGVLRRLDELIGVVVGGDRR
jgi:hypothetical protein